jgi:hypothetical protein
MATENDYHMGLDTELWFQKTIQKQSKTVKLKHMGDKQFDFIGVAGQKKFFLDVKFYKEEYRLKGWLEVQAWGKETGIFAKAREVDEHCFLAVLHKGSYHIIDVKKVQTAIKSGELKEGEGTSWDGGQKCPVKFVIMNDFTDDRFCLFSGKMDLDSWLTLRKVSTLKQMDAAAWCSGQYREINARPLQTNIQSV